MSDKDSQVRERDKKEKDKMKRKSQREELCSLSDIKVGNTVLVRQHKQNKLSTRFDNDRSKLSERKEQW